MKKELEDKGFTGPMITWTRGVDRKKLKPTKGYDYGDRPIVLYVGRVSKEKNLDALCEMQNTYDI